MDIKRLFMECCVIGEINTINIILQNHSIPSYIMNCAFINSCIFNNKSVTKCLIDNTYMFNKKIYLHRYQKYYNYINYNFNIDKSYELVQYLFYLYKHNYNDPTLNKYTLYCNITFSTINKITNKLFQSKNIIYKFRTCNHPTCIYIINNNIVCSICITQIIGIIDYIFIIHLIYNVNNIIY